MLNSPGHVTVSSAPSGATELYLYLSAIEGEFSPCVVVSREPRRALSVSVCEIDPTLGDLERRLA